MTPTTSQKNYFAKMLSLWNDGKLLDNDVYQLFQDMVNSNYPWTNPELSLHARMLIEKNCIKVPTTYNYVHVQVTLGQIEMVRNARENKNSTSLQ